MAILRGYMAIYIWRYYGDTLRYYGDAWRYTHGDTMEIHGDTT